MDKNVAKSVKAVTLLGIYLVLLWIGFRSGEIYNRMRKKIDIEKILVPAPPPSTRYYYIVEVSDRKGYKDISFEHVPDTDVRIGFFLNKKLRPLLKLRNIKIYTHEGDRIY